MIPIESLSQLFNIRRKELSLIYDNSEDLIALLEKRDGEYYTVSLNKTFLTEARKKKSDVVGKPVRAVLRPVLMVGFEEYAARASATETTVRWRHEVSMPRGPRTFSTSFTPIKHGSSKEYMLVVIHDITREEGMERIRQDLASILTHELGTPLALINSKVHRMCTDGKDTLTETQYTHMESIRTSVGHVKELLQVFMALTRFEAHEETSVPTDIIALVDGVIASFDLDCKRRNISIVDQYADGMCTMVTDGALLKIAIGNIISNAVKYAPTSGTIKVTLKSIKGGTLCGGRTHSEDMCVVSVHNTGPRIRDEDMPHIFDKMFRTKHARKSNVAGMGLGLYLVRQIAFVVGGDVWFESDDVSGTTFYFAVPNVHA